MAQTTEPNGNFAPNSKDVGKFHIKLKRSISTPAIIVTYPSSMEYKSGEESETKSQEHIKKIKTRLHNILAESRDFATKEKSSAKWKAGKRSTFAGFPSSLTTIKYPVIPINEEQNDDYYDGDDREETYLTCVAESNAKLATDVPSFEESEKLVKQHLPSGMSKPDLNDSIAQGKKKAIRKLNQQYNIQPTKSKIHSSNVKNSTFENSPILNNVGISYFESGNSTTSIIPDPNPSLIECKSNKPGETKSQEITNNVGTKSFISGANRNPTKKEESITELPNEESSSSEDFFSCASTNMHRAMPIYDEQNYDHDSVETYFTRKKEKTNGLKYSEPPLRDNKFTRLGNAIKNKIRNLFTPKIKRNSADNRNRSDTYETASYSDPKQNKMVKTQKYPMLWRIDMQR